LTPTQLQWVYEARKPVKMFGTLQGGMSEDEIREQYRITYGDD